MHGHYWTIIPHLLDRWNAPTTPGVPWSTQVADERFGSIRLTGWLDEVEDADAIVILVHGMCSTAEVSYIVKAGQEARLQGLSSLRVNLRGADRCGEDIYHAGLTEDLVATIASPQVQKYQKIYVLGFSLGGHVTMSYALQPGPKVRGIAAICAPIDLHTSCIHIDKVRQHVYRRHLLQGLRECTDAVQKKRGVPLSHVDIESISTMREWDSRVVAPRFGFRNATDYYNQVSIAPKLSQMAVPALLVFAEKDPMVSAKDVHPSLGSLNSDTVVRWVEGGHVFFPKKAGAVCDAVDWLTLL